MHDQNNSMTDFSNQPGRDEQLDGSQEIPAAIHSGDTSHESHGYSEENASSPIDERSNDEHSISTQHTQHESDPPDPAQLNQNTSNSSVVPISKRTLLNNDAQIDDIWRHIWSSCAPPKVAACVWRTVHGRLPTNVELYKRGCLQNASLLCPLCEIATETANHLFCDCSIVDLLRCWVHLTPPQLNLLLWKLSFALLSGQKLISILMLAKGYRQIRATVKTLDPFSWWGC
ncbi:hypothetical protein V6N13_090209 [Hibiscus sabdariffa]